MIKKRQGMVVDQIQQDSEIMKQAEKYRAINEGDKMIKGCMIRRGRIQI